MDRSTHSPRRPGIRLAILALGAMLVAAAGPAAAQLGTPSEAQSATVEIAQAELDYFSQEERRAILLRHLESSPEWRVTVEGGDLIAVRRQLADGRWRVRRGGFLADDDPRTHRSRPVFRFAEAPGERGQADEITRASPSEDRVELPIREQDGELRSHLAVGKPGLWFEFVEESEYRQRTLTRETLLWLNSFLGTLHAEEEMIRERGFAPSEMPAAADKASKPEMAVRNDGGAGTYEVRAWVNPREAGTAELRVVDAQSGEALPADDGADMPDERIGWSADSDQLFLFNAPVSIGSDGTTQPREARFELWFEPESGDPRKLAETTHDLSDG